MSLTLAGNSSGTVTSTPAGISCSPTCSASFNSGTSVKLTAVAAKGDFFAGWSGACTGTGTCALTMNSNKTATATFNVDRSVKVLNHIIFMAQENRSLDHYFGALRPYWKDNGYPDRSFDGLPQFNPTSGLAPLYGPPPTNPGCDPAYPPPADCTEDSASPADHVVSLDYAVHRESQPLLERKPCRLESHESLLRRRDSRWLRLDQRARCPQQRASVLRHQRHPFHGLLRRHRS